MDKQKILKDLDELDMYMFNNLGSNGRFRNINDIQAKINLDYITRMETILQVDEVPGVIKSRYLITKAAYEVASNRETQENSQTGQIYFDYVESMRNIARNGVSSTQQALADIAKAAHSNHFPDQRALNAVYSNNLTPAEKRYFDLILKPMLNQIYEATRYKEPQKETALTVQNERTSFFAKIRAKIISIFKPKEQNEEVYRNTQYADTKNSVSWRDLQRVEAENVPNIKPQREPENIVISDLHGNINKWNLVEDYIKNNPTSKVYILGDATDRGNDGVRILRKIYELCKQNRAEYIPGNHDINVYKYLKFDKNEMFSSIMSKNLTQDQMNVLNKLKNYQYLEKFERETLKGLLSSNQFSNKEIVYLHACAEMELNQGLITMRDLDSFRQNEIHQLHSGETSNYITSDELCNWLGKLPIQRKVPVGNRIYLLAHAVPIGAKDNDYNIEKATEDEILGNFNSEEYKRYYTTMWYREKDDRTKLMEPDFPENYFGIVGHNPHSDVTRFFVGGSPHKIVTCIDGSRTPELFAWNLNTNGRYEFKQKQQNMQNYLQNR